MSKHKLLFLLAVAAAIAVPAAIISPSVSYGVVITPPDDNYDIWVRQSNPDTVYQSDAMWTSVTFDGGQSRTSLVQFDLSSVAQPITFAAISLRYRSGGTVTLSPSYWVDSTGFASDLSAVSWNVYTAEILPDETQFSVLGSADFPATGQGLYQNLNFASAPDLAVLNTIRTGDGKVTVVFKATAGGREWTANDTYSGFLPAKLYINEVPPENPDLRLNVNRFTGATSIKNPAFAASFSIDGYSITSTAGSLLPDATNTPGVGWDSITDGGGAGWEEVGPLATALSELNLTNSTAIAAGASRNLGKAFNVAGAKDLAFEYSIAGDTTFAGTVAYVGGLELHVKRLIGAGGVPEGTKLVISNPEPLGIGIDGYVISSVAGSLDPVNFHGYDDANVAGWEEVDLDAFAITELNLSGSSTVGAAGAVILGNGFTTGATKDVAFEYHVPASDETILGPVTYVDVLAGDANGDNVVNIFDINLISSNWNTAGPTGDTNWDGVVNIFDINFVSSHWGNTLSGGGATAVPEPASCLMLSLGALAALARCPRLRSKR